MCLAMNPDKLVGDQLCASSSNRNFKGRQGSPTGRTILMSPLMVAAAAVTWPGVRRAFSGFNQTNRPRGLRRERQLAPPFSHGSRKNHPVTGRAVFVPGNDIDTDRIIPARFMKCVTFDGLGEYLFYDVRKNADGSESRTPAQRSRVSRGPRSYCPAPTSAAGRRASTPRRRSRSTASAP
jgi:hypothetical protein